MPSSAWMCGRIRSTNGDQPTRYPASSLSLIGYSDRKWPPVKIETLTSDGQSLEGKPTGGALAMRTHPT